MKYYICKNGDNFKLYLKGSITYNVHESIKDVSQNTDQTEPSVYLDTTKKAPWIYTKMPNAIISFFYSVIFSLTQHNHNLVRQNYGTYSYYVFDWNVFLICQGSNAP